MSDVAKALSTQLANIEKRSGKSLRELTGIVKSSGLIKHGEIREMLKRDLGLGHGDANTLTHHALKTGSQSAGAAAVASTTPATSTEGSIDEVTSNLYSGAKASLRPIHDKLMAEIMKFGEFEIAPKKTYLSLRRKKQFAMIGPATNTRVEVGLNTKSLEASDRLLEMPPNSMCNYKVKLTSDAEVDGETIAWIKRAFDDAG
jgi:hypothetical protein